VCAEASTVLRAVAADCFFNCWCSEIPSDNRIRHVPRRVHCHAQGFRLETFYNFYVGSGSRTPELYSVSRDWIEYCFICELKMSWVLYRQSRSGFSASTGSVFASHCADWTICLFSLAYLTTLSVIHFIKSSGDWVILDSEYGSIWKEAAVA
jgi:hypothetical protein